MTILDANILLYSYNVEAPQHAPIQAWLKEQVLLKERIGLPWLSLWAFLRVVTNARVTRRPLLLADAFEVVQDFLAMPGAFTIDPDFRHCEILERAAIAGQTTGPRITDAALAAIAIEHGAKLASTDRDFSRFAELKWINPLD